MCVIEGGWGYNRFVIIHLFKEVVVRSKSLFSLVLVVVLLVAVGLMGACGEDNSAAKAALGAALDKVDTAMAEFMQIGEDSTIGDMKAVKGEMSSIWAGVVTAAKDVKGADVEAAEEVWTELETAIDGLADDAPITEAAVLLPTVTKLQNVVGDLRGLVNKK